MNNIISAFCLAAFTLSVHISPLCAFGLEQKSTLNQHNKKFYLNIFGGKGLVTKHFAGPVHDMALKSDASDLYGAGFGYHFNDRFRGEITFVSFQNIDFKGHISSVDDYAQGGPLVPANPQLDNHYKQRVQSNTLAANLYFNLMHRNKINIDLTAGIGMAKNKVGDFFAIPSNDTIHTYNPNAMYRYALPGRDNSTFMWSIGGAISYAMNEYMKWDVVNYKYYDLGMIHNSATALNTALVFTTPVILKEQQFRLRMHTFSTGMRIDF